MAGDTFFSIVPDIHSADVLRTIALAAIVAMVSCTISWLLKWILKSRIK